MVGCKEPSGANEKSERRQIGASSICRRSDFSGLLRNPRPAAQAAPRLACVVFQTYLQPRSRNDVGLPTSMLRQQHSRISKSDRIELARFRSSFVLRRISGARYKSSPIQFTGGNCLKMASSLFARMESRGPSGPLAQSSRPRRPRTSSLPLANFCFSMSPFNEGTV